MMSIKTCSNQGCRNLHFAPHSDLLTSFRHDHNQFTPKKINIFFPQQQQQHHHHHHLFLQLRFSHKYGISRGVTASANIPPDNDSSHDSSSSASSSPPLSSSSSDKNSLFPWKKWLIGAVFSVALPAAGHKGGVFVALKAKINQTVGTVETVTDIVEDIAEQADKLVDEVESKLPEDSNLKKTVQILDDLTDIALEQARKAERLARQVKEAKDELFRLISGVDKTDKAEDEAKVDKND